MEVQQQTRELSGFRDALFRQGDVRHWTPEGLFVLRNPGINCGRNHLTEGRHTRGNEFGRVDNLSFTRDDCTDQN